MTSRRSLRKYRLTTVSMPARYRGRCAWITRHPGLSEFCLGPQPALRRAARLSRQELVKGHAPVASDDRPEIEIDARDLRQHDVRIHLPGKDLGNGRGDVGGRKGCDRNLIEQRLEQMMVLTSMTTTSAAIFAKPLAAKPPQPAPTMTMRSLDRVLGGMVSSRAQEARELSTLVPLRRKCRLSMDRRRSRYACPWSRLSRPPSYCASLPARARQPQGNAAARAQ